MESDLSRSAGPEADEASAVASDRGAGRLGFAGTTRKDTVGAAAGLATLNGNGFGGGPTIPMVPATWDPEAPEGGEEHS
jgi:PPE-repeat protein